MENSLSFTDVVGQYVKLTPVSNTHYSGRCPFCSAEEESLILSIQNQHWICLACDADGDRYDFVAKAEKIGKAEAILLVAHHTNSGKPFPHARYKNGVPLNSEMEASAAPKKDAAQPVNDPNSRTSMSQAATVETLVLPEPPKPALVETAPVAPQAPNFEIVPGVLTPFLEFAKIAPSYQGVAVFDGTLKMLGCDCQEPASSELAGIGEMLEPILIQAGAALSACGKPVATMPATLAFYSDELAIVAHQRGTGDKLRLVVVRLGNPSDVAVVRRLVANAATKLA